MGIAQKKKKNCFPSAERKPNLGWLKVAFGTSHHGSRIAKRHLSLTFHRLNNYHSITSNHVISGIVLSLPINRVALKDLHCYQRMPLNSSCDATLSSWLMLTGIRTLLWLYVRQALGQWVTALQRAGLSSGMCDRACVCVCGGGHQQEEIEEERTRCSVFHVWILSAPSAGLLPASLSNYLQQQEAP